MLSSQEVIILTNALYESEFFLHKEHSFVYDTFLLPFISHHLDTE